MTSAELERHREEARKSPLLAGRVSLRDYPDYVDDREALEHIAALAVPALGDWCAIDVVEDDGSPSRIVVGHADPAKRDLVDALRRYPSDIPGSEVLLEVLRTGEPRVLGEFSDEQLRSVASDDEHYRLMRELSGYSAMILPLSADGRILGAITVVSTDPARRYGPADVALADDLAKRVALAIDNVALRRSLATAERRLRGLVDSLDGIVWEADASTLRFTYVGERVGDLLGYSAQKWIEDEHLWENIIHEADRPAVLAARDRAARVGTEEPLEYRAFASDGRILWLMDRIHAVCDPEGRPTRLHGLILDVTDRNTTERRLDAQHAVARAMAEAGTVAEAATRILQAMCQSLECDVGVLWSVDERLDRLRCVETWIRPGVQASGFEQLSRTTTFERGIGLPGRVWEAGEPAWISNVVVDPSFPRALVALEEGLHGALGFPILLGSAALGVVEFFSGEIREPDEDLLRMMSTIGAQVGQFIVRKRLEERAERILTESKERNEFLAQASALLATSLDYRTTLTSFANLLVPQIADWCGVDMLDDEGQLKRLAYAHVDPSKGELALALAEQYPTDPDAPRGSAQAVRTGRSELVDMITDDMLVQAAQDEEHLRMMRDLGARSGMVVPFSARGRTLGALTLVSATRQYDASDLAFVEDLAWRAALSVDNARLYSERSRVARTLQQSLLPPVLPVVAGVELAARYHPAGQGTDVGGDFYDVFATGRDDWAIVIGDVCGKGAEAAAVTALARYTVRAAAMQARKPTVVLATLNEAMLRQRSDRRYCTVAYARVRRTDEAIRVTIACGGHPQPLVMRTDGKVETAGIPGTLLGFFPDPDLTDYSVQLRPGDALVFYTDGVTEARNDADVFGEERLRELLSAFAGLDAVTIAERLEGEVLAFQSGAPRDDIAILVLRAAE